MTVHDHLHYPTVGYELTGLDSNIYIWNRDHGMLIAKLPGHIGVVNAVSWNPQDHNVFASAGDDGTVRM